MKAVIVFIMALLLVFCGCAKEGEKEKGNEKESSINNASVTAARAGVSVVNKYGVKSGIVEYAMGSAGIELKKMYYFDDFGAKERMETYYEGSLTEVQFTDGSNRYTYLPDDDEKIVWSLGSAGRGISPVVTIDSVRNHRGVTVLPEKVHLGRACEGYATEASGTKMIMYGYKGVQMLMESTGRMETYDKAVKADFDVSIAADKFSVPAGYQVQSIE